ncbi:MAG: type 4a pilus biogenesis protein PilO [bacterium]
MVLSTREKNLATVTAVLVVVAVLITGTYKLLSWAEDSGAQSLAFGVDGLGELLDTLGDIDALKAGNHGIKKQLGNEKMSCIDESQVAELLKAIEQTGKKLNIKVTNFNPTTRPKSKPLPSLEVQISFDCEFNQLVQFLEQIETGEIAVFVRDLRTGTKNPGQPSLKVSMTVVTYLLT